MAVTLTHPFVSAIPDGDDNTIVQPSDWNANHVLQCASGKVLGRSSAGDGDVEELSFAFLGRINALHHGVTGDGSTDDTAAINALIDSVGTAGGGEIWFPAGTYMIALASAVDTSAATFNIGAIKVRHDNVKIVGDGPQRTIFKLVAGGTYGAFEFCDVPLTNGTPQRYNCELRSCTVDGNFTGSAWGGQPLIFGAGTVDCRFDDLYVINSSHYGIGLQNGGHIGTTVTNSTFENCWRDGVDIKNNENSGSGLSVSREIKFDNLTFRQCCRGNDPSLPMAMLDIMSPGVVVSNVQFAELPTDATASITACIRLKQGLDGDSIGRGVGAQYAQISNVTIVKQAGDAPIVCGIAAWAPYANISNVRITGTFDEGIQLAQSYCNVTNCVIDGATVGVNVRALVGSTVDAWPFAGADDCHIIGNALKDCGTGVANVRGRTVIGFNTFDTCTTGISTSSSTSTGMRDYLNTFTSCTTDRSVDQSRSHEIIKGSYPVTVAASGATLTFLDDKGVYSNSGATALATFNLPSAVAGMEFSFVVVDVDGIRVQAAAGDLIRSERSTTATAGYIQSTDQWAYVTVRAVDTANWVMVNFHGAWSYDGTFAATTTESSLNPLTDDGGSLGDHTSKRWSDLALASGAVIYWNGTDVTLTHSANSLAFAGATSGYSFDVPIGLASGGTGANLSDPGADRIPFWDDSAGAVTWLQVGSGLSIAGTTLSSAVADPLTITNTDVGATAGPTLDLYRDSASPASLDYLGTVQFNGEDSVGAKLLYANIKAQIGNISLGAESGVLLFGTRTAGAVTDRIGLGSQNLYPVTDDTVYLGASSFGYKGLYFSLTSGGTLYFYGHTANVKITGTATDCITVSNGSFVVGSSVATTATDGFLYIPSCAGTPTGTPTSRGSAAPVVYDSTNNAVYIYDGGWIQVTGSSTAPPQGRLSLTSGEPVTVSDVTAATTVYYEPYLGNLVPLYNGATFVMTNTGGALSQATSDTTKSPAAVTTNSNYDMFVWSDGGTIRCTRGPAWSTSTSRGTGAGTTEIERVNGFWVNKVAITNGPSAQRGTYVGTIRSNGSSQIDDSVTLRHVWNMYNRVLRPFSLPITTDSWTYSTATWRQVQASSTYQVSLVRGIDEDAVRLMYRAACNNSTATPRAVQIGIGVDSTTAFSGISGNENATSTTTAFPQTEYIGLPGLGYHYLALLERTEGTDTQTWYGDAGVPTTLQMGAVGFCLA